ncbi:hypothetical protein LEP1GSC185_0961 [Leptospira licerasiae serovar Varillal str. VAR 010]|uniref:Uncharacterized protein n=1 Tax=Leptospira licerasiae str. MMD4847 TaxID=1049971 RepID=A0ABN0H9Y7_9LEPT|nr:hypothetical protein LEP1GSC185_0961 [Leptospira licerasiae serovar Varillal str. VAR 010]EJZ42503.1 hypothetical protein LEP1GSC178_3583 [Leptospira licerasiae str. MMD4847]
MKYYVYLQPPQLHYKKPTVWSKIKDFLFGQEENGNFQNTRRAYRQ